MKVIAVSGSGSGSGKTTLVARLIAALPGWGALKTSPVAEGGDAHGLAGHYELVLDTATLASPGSDSRIYMDAGAGRVGWLIARPPLAPAARDAVIDAFRDVPGLIVEGGSLADPFSPDRSYVVMREGAAAPKPEALARASRAGAIVVNSALDRTPEIEAILDDVREWARR